jgi:glucokinase
MIFEEFGTHLGNAIRMVLYMYCPELIVLGGSISKAYPLFQENMWKRIHTYIYSNTLNHIRLEVSNLDNSGILGAASLYYDSRI